MLTSLPPMLIYTLSLFMLYAGTLIVALYLGWARLQRQQALENARLRANHRGLDARQAVHAMNAGYRRATSEHPRIVPNPHDTQATQAVNAAGSVALDDPMERYDSRQLIRQLEEEAAALDERRAS